MYQKLGYLSPARSLSKSGYISPARSVSKAGLSFTRNEFIKAGLSFTHKEFIKSRVIFYPLWIYQKLGYQLLAMDLPKSGYQLLAMDLPKSGYQLLAMDLSKSGYMLLEIDLSKVELSLAMKFLKDELSSAKRIYQRQSHQSPYSGLWIISLSLFRLKHFKSGLYIIKSQKKHRIKLLSWCLGADLSLGWHSYNSWLGSSHWETAEK